MKQHNKEAKNVKVNLSSQKVGYITSFSKQLQADSRHASSATNSNGRTFGPSRFSRPCFPSSFLSSVISSDSEMPVPAKSGGLEALDSGVPESYKFFQFEISPSSSYAQQSVITRSM